MNDEGDHSAPSTHLVHDITFPVHALPFFRPLYIPDNPRSFFSYASATFPGPLELLPTYRTLQPHLTALATRRAVNTLCIQFHGSLISRVATAQMQILALPWGDRGCSNFGRSRERGAVPG
ncbi:hypothetical protein B0H13DRAFT_1887627 [Mycena leptocephala]|nr:hypothetical protein B0H13DRAFT_1887627 [Mycena leptocephala]